MRRERNRTRVKTFSATFTPASTNPHYIEVLMPTTLAASTESYRCVLESIKNQGVAWAFPLPNLLLPRILVNQRTPGSHRCRENGTSTFLQARRVHWQRCKDVFRALARLSGPSQSKSSTQETFLLRSTRWRAVAFSSAIPFLSLLSPRCQPLTMICHLALCWRVLPAHRPVSQDGPQAPERTQATQRSQRRRLQYCTLWKW